MWGRDAIFLDHISYDYELRRITFTGEINAASCSALQDVEAFLSYSLTFQKVLAPRQTELDFFDGPYDSSFFIMTTSPWLGAMKARDHSEKLLPEH